LTIDSILGSTFGAVSSRARKKPKTSATGRAFGSDRRWNLRSFHAVGRAYDEFTQATYDEVRALLSKGRPAGQLPGLMRATWGSWSLAWS